MPTDSLIQMPADMPDVPEGMVAYTVTLETPTEVLDVDLNGFSGPAAAARRAFFTVIHAGHGDLDTVTVTAVRLADGPW
jgi:hypothetical protein